MKPGYVWLPLQGGRWFPKSKADRQIRGTDAMSDQHLIDQQLAAMCELRVDMIDAAAWLGVRSARDWFRIPAVISEWEFSVVAPIPAERLSPKSGKNDGKPA
jgi:hypothetical protein